jgi:hypothetical protein
VGGVVDLLIDAPNDISQQSLFFLINAFPEHDFSLPSSFSAGKSTPIASQDQSF